MGALFRYGPRGMDSITMTVLVKWNGIWCLAERNRCEPPSTTVKMHWSMTEDAKQFGFMGAPGFPFWVKAVSEADQIEWYPRTEFRGLFVRPDLWDHESPVPKVRWRLSGNHQCTGSELLNFTGMLALTQKTKGNPSPEERRQIVQAEAKALELRAQLIREGWLDWWDEGLVRTLSVEEVEKYPGPAPAEFA